MYAKTTLENKMSKIKTRCKNEGRSYMSDIEYIKYLQMYNKILRKDKEKDLLKYKLRDAYKKEVLDSQENNKKTLNELFKQVKKEVFNDKKRG